VNLDRVTFRAAGVQKGERDRKRCPHGQRILTFVVTSARR
jgi:hypothetical protein